LAVYVDTSEENQNILETLDISHIRYHGRKTKSATPVIEKSVLSSVESEFFSVVV
jgi:hypothetical protein